jgi:hypothetical protein
MAALAAGVLVAALVPAVAAKAATTAAAGIQIRAAHSGKCLNVSGASTADRAKIIQYTCAGAAATNDKFKIVPRGGGNYWIQVVGSGKCLNVSGNSTANNAAIIQYTCNNQSNGLWKVDEVLDQPTIRFVSASSGKCLNIPNSSTADSVGVIQYSCTNLENAANEQFYLPPTSKPTASHRGFTSKQPVSVLQGLPPAGEVVAPVYYSYIRADNQLQIITDRNPDPENTDPNAPEPVFVETYNFGYTGRTQNARLADGRVQVLAHDAAAGDAVLADETTAGTGGYGDLWDIGGAFGWQPALGHVAPDGRLATFAVIGGALWYAPQILNDAQAAYGSWRSLGGTDLTGTPATAVTRDGARIFVRNTAGQLLTATLAGSTLSAWTNLGGTGLSGTPSVVLNPGYTASIFIRSGDGTVVTKKQDIDGTFPADWAPIAGLTTAGSPSAVMDLYPGRIAVAARGTDGLVYLAYETAQAAGTFSDWIQISEPDQYPETVAASDPTAFSYDVPSGMSFGIAFQSVQDIGVPVVYTFQSAQPAATGSAKKVAKGAVPHAERHALAKAAKSVRLTD